MNFTGVRGKVAHYSLIHTQKKRCDLLLCANGWIEMLEKTELK